MSTTTADIIDGIARLITALKELLETDTVEALVDLVKKLGIGQPVKVGLQALARVLDILVGWIEKLEQVARIPAFLETLDPAFEQVKELASSSGQEMRDMGLGSLAPVVDASRAAIDLADKIRRGAEIILKGYLPEQSIVHLRESVQGLANRLRQMQQKLDAPAAAPAATANKSLLPAGAIP
ncbi:hypothetical protein JRI60_32275 [Archangium violaceum]|uniref:hypothetical protein n=1 Tax=Archangium violaceum TaxID=83451 RepID=UPI00195201E9|nr:hypothetical protein [Archangium violaceum]QRN93823.1 hypothetical protein JRI60_32275 [Archangium violaceum]